VKTIHNLAEYINSRDTYRTDIKELTAQFGVGHYTASAYLSLHMNVRAILVDSNVTRWRARIKGKENPSDVTGGAGFGD
jgi:adenine-specific DNA glycosylase